MRILRELDLEIARFYEKCEVGDSIIGLRNGILTALLILEAAEQSGESRGCHYRINEKADLRSPAPEGAFDVEGLRHR
jgi:aspartate oxidase